MLDPLIPNPSESPGRAAIEEQPSSRLLERISELEEENANLRRLEETIHANNRFFEALLRSGHEGIILLNPSLVIVRLIHSTLGYSEKDVLGHPVLAFIHPDDVSRFEESCAHLISGHTKTEVVQTRALGPGHEWIWVEAALTDLLDDPHVQAIVLNFRKITGPGS